MLHLNQPNVSDETFSLKTLTVNCYLRPLKSGVGHYRLYIQILFNRTKSELSTGISCKKGDWDAKKEQFNKNTIHNQRLAVIREKILRAKNKLDESSKSYDARDIKKLVVGSKQSPTKLVSYVEEYICKKKNLGHTSVASLKLYKKTGSYIKEFLISIDQKEVLIKSFSLSAISAWDDYLKGVVWNDKGDQLGVTTINKHHTRLKTIFNDAIKREYLERNPYNNFRLSFPPANREYLTREELERIKEVNLNRNETLDKVRDIFLFSCYTGLRFGDAMALKMEDIKTINGEPHIRVDQIKTGARREIPLLNPAKDIVSKYTWSGERTVYQKVLPTLTNQRVNQYLKVIADLASINKRLSHHIARHTCATTILLDNNVPLEVVSHWLGHMSIKTTQIYAKISHSNLKKQSDILNKLI